MNSIRSLAAGGLALGALLTAAPVLAGAPPAPEVIVETEIVEMNLSTAAPTPVPLASDPGNALGDSVDGYGFVDSQVTISESATEQSLLQATISLADPSNITVFASLDLFMDLAFTDVDAGAGRDYAGLPDGATLDLLASSGNPLHVEQSGAIDLTPLLTLLSSGSPTPPTDAELIDALMAGTTLGAPIVTPAEYLLGSDLNGNGENDKVKLGIDAVDLGNVAFDITAGDIDNIIDQILTGGVTLPLMLGASIGITSADITFAGDVLDESSDPPFTVTTTGSLRGIDPNAPAAVPGPATLLLLAMGLLATAVTARLRR